MYGVEVLIYYVLYEYVLVGVLNVFSGFFKLFFEVVKGIEEFVNCSGEFVVFWMIVFMRGYVFLEYGVVDVVVEVKG